MHSNYKGASSGRHLLVPIDGSAKPFSSAAVATCEVKCKTPRKTLVLLRKADSASMPSYCLMPTRPCVYRNHVWAMHRKALSGWVVPVQIWVPAGLLHEISSVELGLHGECKLWAPEKVLLRPYGHTSWTVFPCDSILSNC